MVDRETILRLKKSDNTIAREDIIDLAIKKFDSPETFQKRNKSNGTISLCYPFSNENLTSLFNRIDCKGKRVATVGSSLDQVFNAIYNDAEYVAAMDANVYTLPFGEYKKAVIEVVDYDEFQRFLINPQDMMKYSVMRRVLDQITPEAKVFWEHLMEIEDNPDIYNTEILTDKKSAGIWILNNDVTARDISSPFYSDKKAYYMLREKLECANIDYVLSEMSDFSKDINGVFDVILLSNIHRYKTEQGFYGDGGVRGLFYNHLADFGTMQLHSINGQYVAEGTLNSCVDGACREIERNLRLFGIGGELESYTDDNMYYSILLNKTPEKEASR